MKKFLYLAIMALTVGFFASCSAGANGSDYYKDGKEPQIDYNNATVNGKKYDNQKEKCWCWTMKATVLGVTSSEEEYLWGTEFDLVAACETAMYAFAQTNTVINAKASYTYINAPYYDSESCLENNDKD